MLRILIVCVVAVALSVAAASSQPPASNVVVITIDGYRWQDMFGGVASEYFVKDSKGQPGVMENRFWRSTPVERRSG